MGNPLFPENFDQSVEQTDVSKRAASPVGRQRAGRNSHRYRRLLQVDSRPSRATRDGNVQKEERTKDF